MALEGKHKESTYIYTFSEPLSENSFHILLYLFLLLKIDKKDHLLKEIYPDTEDRGRESSISNILIRLHPSSLEIEVTFKG